MSSTSRRFALKMLGLGSALANFDGRAAAQDASAEPPSADWTQTADRVWLGPNVWANPMEDWRVVDGAAESQSGGANRNIQLLTHQLTDPTAELKMSVRLQRAETGKTDGGAGFRIGIHSDINEYRSNCFSGGGIGAGIRKGQLYLGQETVPVTADADRPLDLSLTGKRSGDKYELKLQVTDPESGVTGSLTQEFPVDRVLGNVALVSNSELRTKQNGGCRYRFSAWHVTGDAFTVTKANEFGPILWSMYSLSDSRGDDGFVMKMTALTGPLGKQDRQDVELQIRRAGEWQSAGFADLDTDAWTATFRIANWNASTPADYRLVYRQRDLDGRETESEWSGQIKANPKGRPMRLGALTCQKDYGFPYQPVATNLVKLDPDMLYFSGDQLYEGHGGFGLIRDPADAAILNYLRKFYMFGWAFRDAMKDRPTLCLPDDHDVFQGNIWGEGGAKMTAGSTSSKGGYREPARMVNAVHRTCTSHHPDFYDTEPVKQQISVYHGEMIYGDVGFAVIADRQFKSGPERVETGSGRADHVKDPAFDSSKLDQPGLVLLGQRQEDFLKHWANDWRGHQLKVLLSQTVFAGVATHHGSWDGYLRADLDSGGWPQTARDRAVRLLRDAMPLHINGDQHLTSLSQYGADTQRDGCWSFCTPAIAAGYPRWWRPDEIGMPHTNRPAHGIPNTGEYLDGFGNKVYVYTVGNPEVGSKKNRYELAHQKGSGFGLVTIDPKEKTYRVEAYRFLVDATDGDPENQFPGFPVTIAQSENAGQNLIH